MSTETIDLDAKSTPGPQDAKPAPEVGSTGGQLSNPKTKYAVLAVLALLAVGSIAAWLYYRNRETTDDAQVDGHLAPVASKIYGSVAEVLVNDNQAVKSGDVLVRIDPRDLEVRVSQERAALALARSRAQGAKVTVPMTESTTSSGISAAEAEVDRARVGFNQATTADLAYAQANVEKDRANAERAHADLERVRSLAAKAEISALQFDSYQAAARVADSEMKAGEEKLAQAQKNADMTHAALTAAEARLAEARGNATQVSVQSASAAAAQAAITQAEANLAAAELEASYTTIVAPVDGVVTRRSVERGQIVQPGQGLMVIVPLQYVYVTANFKETQLAHVRPGQRAEIKVDMYGKTFPAHVDSISGASGAMISLMPPENATGNFVKVVERIPVKIVFDRGALGGIVLRPGMNVEATIFTE